MSCELDKSSAVALLLPNCFCFLQQGKLIHHLLSKQILQFWVINQTRTESRTSLAFLKKLYSMISMYGTPYVLKCYALLLHQKNNNNISFIKLHIQIKLDRQPWCLKTVRCSKCWLGRQLFETFSEGSMAFK